MTKQSKGYFKFLLVKIIETFNKTERDDMLLMMKNSEFDVDLFLISSGATKYHNMYF